MLLYITHSSREADDAQGFKCSPDMNSGLSTKIELRLTRNKYGCIKRENKSARV